MMSKGTREVPISTPLIKPPVANLEAPAFEDTVVGKPVELCDVYC